MLKEILISEFYKVLCSLRKGKRPELDDIKNMIILLEDKDIENKRQLIEHYITKYEGVLFYIRNKEPDIMLK